MAFRGFEKFRKNPEETAFDGLGQLGFTRTSSASPTG
jgi:hypothetical protein